jgi:hypothetical protein
MNLTNLQNLPTGGSPLGRIIGSSLPQIHRHSASQQLQFIQHFESQRSFEWTKQKAPTGLIGA